MKKRETANSKEPSLPFKSGSEKHAEIWIDGASRGNPGDSGAGILIKDREGNTRVIKRYLGKVTNNQAEYEALLTALGAAIELKKTHLKIHTDSLLLASQMNGVWRVKDPKINIVYEKAKELVREFAKVEIMHVPRELNREADRLANLAIDEHT